MANELMLRLTYKGKVVGHEEHAYNENLARITTWYRRENSETWSGVSLLHDSFDLGVQINGAWVFEGDVMENITYKTKATLFRAESGRWMLQTGNVGFASMVPFMDRAEYWRVIGNIHEEGSHGL